MLPTEWKRLQAKKLKEQKIKVHQKISNNFIENVINKNTVGALKTIYYLATIIENMDGFVEGSEKGMLKTTIETRQMLQYTGLQLPEIKRNLKAMQETSITFINEAEKIEIGINLLPYYEFVYGKNKINIEIYQKIANMIVEVKKNYTMIDTQVLMQLKSKHTLRMLPLLYKIANYSDDAMKRKRFELEDLNGFFGTKYKKFSDIERRILKPVKEELDINSKISFVYDINFIQLDTGRPKAHNIVIDVVDNKGSLFAQ